ncbi:MAG: hypothetical protein AB7K52_03100 [Phycisphaerales bacterium]
MSKAKKPAPLAGPFYPLGHWHGPVSPVETKACHAFLEFWRSGNSAPLAELLAPECKYASQSVLEELVGKQKTLDYMAAKRATIFRKVAPGSDAMRIGSVPDTGGSPRPCVIATRNGTDPTLAVFDVENDQVRCITWISIVPPPASAVPDPAFEPVVIP